MYPKTLDEWLAWQSTLHPHRMELGLDRVAEVWSRLGAPALGCPVITVGGTNGKGSCVAYLDTMAQAAGYRTASYTSPHLLSYNERVRIGGEPATDAALCEAFARVEGARGETPLTYFEFGTLAALGLFAAAAPDLVVLEVGLGGRLDAVNLIDADCAVVTSIGHDHTAWLGSDLDAIAREKAGIFRPGRPAVIGAPDAPARLRAEAERLGARVLQVGREIGVEPESEGAGWVWTGPEGERLAMPTPAMRGVFQHHNAAAAITALRVLKGRLPVAVGALRAGLGRARLPGRFQVMPGEVSLILDVAHNPEAAQALAGNLRAYRRTGRMLAVLGVLGDKEPEAIVQPLCPLVDGWYLTASRDARAMPADELARRLSSVLKGATVTVLPGVAGALAAARAAAAPGDCLLVFGSFTTVAEVLAQGPDRATPAAAILGGQ
jgi:dihydrofolate synthase / folylpolyglutamate synthase